MTLGSYMAQCFTLPQTLEFCLRLLVSCACGAAIGLERSKRFKDAGVRTHIIVCIGAALVMIVSKYGFADLTLPDGSLFGGTHGVDAARLAAQVVSGISFLCAGVIFKSGNFTVKGLTTAACVWLTAGIGLTIGAGMYFIGIFTTVAELILQFLMHKMPLGADLWTVNQIRLVIQEGAEFNPVLNAQMKAWNAVIAESKMTRRRNGKVEYEITIRRKDELSFDEFEAFVNGHGEILSGSCMPVR